MYTDFYNLQGLPFQLTPDPRFYFDSSVHKKAMAHLTYGMHQGEGFIVITGDVGAGKTTLVAHLLDTLEQSHYVAANIVTTQLEADDMLRMVASAFGIPMEDADKATLLRRIELFLSDHQTNGRRCLLLVDEAQNLSVKALEELRMLSNFQTAGQAPLQSFLLGQPQFRRTLASVDLDQLRQRVLASYHLGPMNQQETRDYVRHRLRAVGWENDPEISESAYPVIYRHTGGVPRRINVLCSRLLLYGFLEESHRLDDEDVESVAADLTRETEQVLDGEDDAAALEDEALNGGDSAASQNSASPPGTAAVADPAASAPASGVPGNGAAPAADVAALLERIAHMEQQLNRHERLLRRADQLIQRHSRTLRRAQQVITDYLDSQTHGLSQEREQ